MTQYKTSDELYNQKRRERAAEIIAALMRKRRRTTSDEALLDVALRFDRSDKALR